MKKYIGIAKERFIDGLAFGVGFFCIIFLVLVIVSIYFLLAKSHLNLFGLDSYLLNTIEPKVKISPNEMKVLSKALHNGIIIPPQELLAHIISFYDGIIAFLMGILALSGVLSFIYYRARSSKEMRAQLSEEIKSFSDSTHFKTILGDVVAQNDYINRISDIEEQFVGIEEKRLEYDVKIFEFEDSLNELREKYVKLIPKDDMNVFGEDDLKLSLPSKESKIESKDLLSDAREEDND